jgi:hypothetical protein
MVGQYFLYRKNFNDKDVIRIFDIREDEDGVQYGRIITMYPDGRPTHEGMPETIGYMRDAWKKSIRNGWLDKATCKCGQEYDAGWYVHIGQCPTCEAQDELEAQYERDMIADCAKS